MALRDQPYIPLYIQDIMTDEKLIECSAESHGVYLRLMCILHKQENYGILCLKQKYKQDENKYICFSKMLSKQMPFDTQIIEKSLIELHEERVIDINKDELHQKRMVKDGKLSLLRSEIGKKGGSNVTKQYGKSGFLYLMSDEYDKTKIGISVNPQNRLYRLRSDLKLPKHFEIKKQINVDDMGKSEDFAQNYFKDCIDGEWLKGDYIKLKNRFDLLETKLKANIQASSEDEIEVVIDNESIIKTIEFISKKFGITEMKHFRNYEIITNCVVCQFNQGDELFKHFKDQCYNYFLYKEKAEEKKHSFKIFIGSPEEKFIDGGWNAENWIKKFLELTGEGVNSHIQPKEENKNKIYYGSKRKYETDLAKITIPKK